MSTELPYLFADDLPPDATADAQPALQRWIDLAQASSRPLVLPPRRNLSLDAPVVVKHGIAPGGGPRQQLSLLGNDCVLRPRFSAGAALVVAPQCPRSQAGSGRGEATVQLRDLHFAGGLTGGARAIAWGRAGYQCSSFAYSLLENVVLDGFDSPAALLIESARHVEFRRVVCRPGAGVQIVNQTDGDACGDLYFANCEFNGSASVRPLDIHARSQSRRTSCGGLHFDHCVVYGAGSRLLATGRGRVGDVHLDCCAWDGPTAAAGEHVLELRTEGVESEIMGVHIVSPRVTGNFSGCVLKVYGAGSFRTIAWQGGEVRRVRVDESASPSALFLLAGCSGVRVSGVQLWECSATSLFNLWGHDRPCRGILLEGCHADGGGIGNLAYLSPHAHDDVRITGLTGDAIRGVLDRSTGPPSRRLIRHNMALAPVGGGT